jgi:isocitrate dehydrogenase
METLIVQPKSKKQLSAIKAVLKALDVSFKNAGESLYDQAFVEKILQGDEDFKAGKGEKMTIDELNSLWK